jgi:hypothetical protein
MRCGPSKVRHFDIVRYSVVGYVNFVRSRPIWKQIFNILRCSTGCDSSKVRDFCSRALPRQQATLSIIQSFFTSYMQSWVPGQTPCDITLVSDASANDFLESEQGDVAIIVVCCKGIFVPINTRGNLLNYAHRKQPKIVGQKLWLST